MSDRELAAGLRAAFGRPVELTGRRPWARRSSLPMEELCVDGEWLLFKDLSPGPRAERPDFIVDPWREISVYREILAPAAIGAPELRGTLADRTRAWLFLERVDGVPLDEADAFAPWEDAARWLARLHALPVPAPASARLLRHDAPWLRRWAARAFGADAALNGLADVAERAVERLAAWPTGLVHGEFYPANVLVADGRIRPVDWETAGIGPGLLDLAALTSGAWELTPRARIETAYREALPPERRPDVVELTDALVHARLLVALQWLGWEQGFQPPPEHAHDWRGEAQRLAGELAA